MKRVARTAMKLTLASTKARKHRSGDTATIREMSANPMRPSREDPSAMCMAPMAQWSFAK